MTEKIGLKSKRKQEWFWLENEVIDNENMTIYEKMVYITLVRFCDNQTSSCFPSFETIAKKTGCSSRQVIRTIKKLEDRGLIKKVQRKIPDTKELDSNLYYIFSIKDSYVVTDSHNPYDSQSQQVVTDSHNPYDSQSQQVVTDSHSKKTNSKNTNIYIDLSFLDADIENVKLTETEYQKLVNRYDQSYIRNMILSLENYIINGKGKKYKNHYKVLLTWASKDPNAPKSKVINVEASDSGLKRIGIDDSKISRLS